MLAGLLAFPALYSASGVAQPSSALDYLEGLNQLPYLEVSQEGTRRSVARYMVPLGAIQKVRGSWSPRESERLSGTLHRYTWRVLDGFNSQEVIADLVATLGSDDRYELLFSCEARACGSSVQWANRVFEERLLYGREVSQRYFVYRVSESAGPSTPVDTGSSVAPASNQGASGQGTGMIEKRLLLYASARSANRQYLHGEYLESSPGTP
ncbi:MAG: DUF4892 domain-containing protein [Pseudomonadota bacterium]